MKVCTKCGIEKNESEFYWKNKAKGVLRYECKSCLKAYNQQHYLDNKAVYTTRAKEHRKRVRVHTRKSVWEYLQAHPCVDCGETDPVVLEFDHRDPNHKSYTVASMVTNGYGWEAVQAEIVKCVVRCANCHRRRTAEQFNWYNY